MLIKLLISFLFVFFSNSLVFAIKPCNGLAGYKLGEKLNVENAKFYNESYDLRYYEVNIIKPFMDFNKCIVGITPNTYLIASIKLEAEPQKEEKGKQFFENIKGVLESHYEISKIDKNDDPGVFVSDITYEFPNNRIMCVKKVEPLFSSYINVKLEVQDKNLLKLGINETKKNKEEAIEKAKQEAIKNTDTSGLE